MRSPTLLFAFFVSLVAITGARAADVEFKRVRSSWRDAAAFDRISEYFTGQENTGREIIVRTKPEVRAGFYFLARVANHADALAGATFALHLIRPDSPEPKTYRLPVAAVPHGETVFELGLTGPEFPDKKFHPVAWKLELLAADGHVVVSQASFLWEKPDKK